jgi:hypothetical protein
MRAGTVGYRITGRDIGVFSMKKQEVGGNCEKLHG